MRHLKILVLGPHRSGKTTIIRRISKNVITTDVNGTTVGLDFGILQNEDLLVHLFGSPGMRHFNLVRKVLSNGSDGIVLVIDSTDPASVKEAEHYLHDIYGSNIPPVIVAANKQDKIGALSPYKIQRLLSISAPVYPISALQNYGLDKLILTFIRHLLQIGKGRDIHQFTKDA